MARLSLKCCAGMLFRISMKPWTPRLEALFPFEVLVLLQLDIRDSRVAQDAGSELLSQYWTEVNDCQWTRYTAGSGMEILAGKTCAGCSTPALYRIDRERYHLLYWSTYAKR